MLKRTGMHGAAAAGGAPGVSIQPHGYVLEIIEEMFELGMEQETEWQGLNAQVAQALLGMRHKWHELDRLRKQLLREQRKNSRNKMTPDDGSKDVKAEEEEEEDATAAVAEEQKEDLKTAVSTTIITTTAGAAGAGRRRTKAEPQPAKRLRSNSMAEPQHDSTGPEEQSELDDGGGNGPRRSKRRRV